MQRVKKLTYLFLLPLVFIGTFSLGFAQDSAPGAEGYVPLAPIPGFTAGEGDQALGQYINSIYQVSIGLGAVLAVLMIVVGGLQYMSTDAFSGKTAGKTRIRQALLGLGLLLVSFVFLNTINPELLDLDVNITPTPEIDGLDGQDANETVVSEKLLSNSPSVYAIELENQQRRLETEKQRFEAQGFELHDEKPDCSGVLFSPGRNDSESQKRTYNNEHENAFKKCQRTRRNYELDNPDSTFGECLIRKRRAIRGTHFCFAEYK